MDTSAAHSRFPVPAIDSLPGDLAERIGMLAEKMGFVPNVFAVLAYRRTRGCSPTPSSTAWRAEGQAAFAPARPQIAQRQAQVLDEVGVLEDRRHLLPVLAVARLHAVWPLTVVDRLHLTFT
jgi:hypothetical protein